MIPFILNVQKRQIYIETKKRGRERDLWLPWAKKEQELTASGCEGFYWGNRNVLKLLYDNGRATW